MTYNTSRQRKKSSIERAVEKLARSLEQPEKLFVVVLFFGVLTIVGGVWFWRVNIYNSFTQNITAREQESLTAQQAVDGYNKLLDDQRKDTDKDGLSDYFELNIYKTSPYLPDSDSDGFTDKEEIDQNTNPNCPEGTECGFIAPTDDAGQDLIDALAPEGSSQLSFDIQIGQEMRKLLIENGVDPELLEDVTDSELAQLYEQVIAEEGKTNSSVSTSETPPEDIDPATLRELLLSSGVEQDVLDGLSDEELMESYLETLEAQN